MSENLSQVFAPRGGARYLFFGGKGGVGKTTLAAATAVWFADRGQRTAIVSTDPTVSLSAVFGQPIGGQSLTPIEQVPLLRGLNINPNDAKGVFQQRLNGMMGRLSESPGRDLISTPCAEEMAAFDQFVDFLDMPEDDVVVFDTAPTGKTLRELAMPFDWAGFLQKQILEGKELARLMNMDESSFEGLERDRLRYDRALGVMRNPATTIFTLVLLAERLPIEETDSAITGLGRLGIPVQALVVNQCIPPEVVEGNRFLARRAQLQSGYLEEIARRFGDLTRADLPLLDHDIADLAALREVGAMLYGEGKALVLPGRAH